MSSFSLILAVTKQYQPLTWAVSRTDACNYTSNEVKTREKESMHVDADGVQTSQIHDHVPPHHLCHTIPNVQSYHPLMTMHKSVSMSIPDNVGIEDLVEANIK